jgi:hypothetical protein
VNLDTVYIHNYNLTSTPGIVKVGFRRKTGRSYAIF